MHDYPLLDLRDTWREVQRALRDLQDQAEAFWHASEDTWLDMLILRQRVVNAVLALGALPPTVVQSIAADEADLDEWEAKADASS